jgi:hypothetical protein
MYLSGVMLGTDVSATTQSYQKPNAFNLMEMLVIMLLYARYMNNLAATIQASSTSNASRMRVLLSVDVFSSPSARP